jgi:hypothetical protein
MNVNDDMHLIVGGDAFAAALADFIVQAPPQWWISAERFDDWPLERPEVVAALTAWSRRHAQGELRIFARDYGHIERHGARFMQWRRLFAHLLQIKRWPQRLPDEESLPRGVLQPRAALLLSAAARPGQLLARASADVREIAVLSEPLQAAWDMGHYALPAQTLGL